MITFNEQLEAANLLRLLMASRSRLAAFNAGDGEIAAACGIVPSDREAMAQARLAWYLRLALWEERQRLSGCCSLVFGRAERIRRAPYDLLARCPLTAAEKAQADVPAELLTGLNARDRARKRRLYHRLLCIQPMRRLLERLHALAKLARDTGGDGGELLKLIGSREWRSPIAPLEDRKSGLSLNVRDNDFTILDRLIAAHGQRLRRNVQVKLPGKLLRRADVPEPLLLAAIVGGMDRSGERRGCTQYRAIPGGHTRLDVYRAGTMEDFVKRAREDQEKHAEKLVHVRYYNDFQLVQLPPKTAGLIPYEARRKLHLGRGSRKPPVPCLLREPAGWSNAPCQDAPLPDWQTLYRELASLSEPMAAGVMKNGAFAALDNGGSSVYRALRDALSQAAAADREEPKADAKKAPVSNEDCMFRFCQGQELEPLHLERAIAELRRQVGLLFETAELPEKYSKDPMNLLANSSSGWQARAVKLFLAFLSKDRLLVDERVPGRIPAKVAAAIDRLAEGGAAREEYREFLRARAVRAVAEPKLMTVNVRYASLQGRSCFMCWSTPMEESLGMKAWFAGGGTGKPAMTQAQLDAWLLFGLGRYIFDHKSIEPRSEKLGFSMKVNPTGFPKEPDLLFRLFVIHAALRLTRMTNAPVGTQVYVTLKKNFENCGASFLADARNHRIPFVEVGEQTGKQSANFTPKALPRIASLAFQWNLRITWGQDDEDDVCLTRVT